MNVRTKRRPAQHRSGSLALGLTVVAGCGSVGLVWALPALAVPLATASAVVGAAWPMAAWLQKRAERGADVREE